MNWKKLIIGSLLWLALLAPAVQATQTIITIDPSVPGGDTGTTMANKLNDWRSAILTMLSGSSRPSAAVAGTMWLDTSTSTWAVKLYNGTNDTTLFTVDSTNLRPIFAGAVPWVNGSGTVNAITATYSPVIGSLIEGTLVGVRATGANSSTTPTFQANSTFAKTIVKANNQPLLAGDIAGANHELLLRYASGIDKWVLLNPAIAAVAPNSVTSSSIVDGQVASADIADGTVSSTDIANATITNDDIASNTLLTGNISDGTIAIADLASAVSQALHQPGEVIAWAGNSCPTRTLEANGATISRTTYSSLFTNIGTRWGTGDGSTTFHLPDFRGRFLRGQDKGAGRDPDAGSRTASNAGGLTGDNVGSIQDDAFESHTHNYNDKQRSDTTNQGDGSGSQAKNRGEDDDIRTSQATGGSESRPINAYVLYCIYTGV